MVPDREGGAVMANTALAKLLADHCFDAVEWGSCECGKEFPNAEAWSEHLAELISREHLVVPRSDIVGTEYGYRYQDPKYSAETYSTQGSRTQAIEVAENIRSGQIRKGNDVNAVALERPVLPWSVIPLFEDCQAVRLSKARQDGLGTLVEDVDLGAFPSMDEAKQAGDRDAGRPLDWGSLCGDGRLWAEPDWSDYNWFISPVPLPEDGQ